MDAPPCLDFAIDIVKRESQIVSRVEALPWVLLQALRDQPLQL
jgi:hypothetical protein